MSRIGIMGGSFDPVHVGHLITASLVFELRGLEKIIFIPCRQSPHKLEEAPTDSIHRMEMVKLAIEGDGRFALSDFEINGQQISYTIDTVKHFKQRYDELDLIIGYDNLLVFDKWKNPDELINLVNVVALRRKTDSVTIPTHKYYSMATIVESPFIDVSSSNIRERIRQGLSIRYMVPEKTFEYIKQNSLYGTKE